MYRVLLFFLLKNTKLRYIDLKRIKLKGKATPDYTFTQSHQLPNSKRLQSM